jgi:glycosyltransferase involved in cell wall biosynthesis
MTQRSSANNLLLFNLVTDADDPILGFTTTWINRLAAHFDQIDVITMSIGRLAVADNVQVESVGKEQGRSDAEKAAAFYRLLNARLGARRYAACFAHMMPLFAAMSAPLLLARRVPITLWYTHRQVSRTLSLAAQVSRRIVTAAADSFPIQTPKLRVIGHGIDTDFFAPISATDSIAPSSPHPRIVQIARIAPIKNQATLLRAISSIPNSRAVFIGDVIDAEGEAYKRTLEQRARALGVFERATFAGMQNALGVREALRRATVAVNLSPPGLFDKAALESMAVGLPTIVSSPAFDDLLGEYAPLLRIPTPEDATSLAARLTDLLKLPLEARMRIGLTLRDRVVETHSLEALIPRLVSVLRSGELPSS